MTPLILTPHDAASDAAGLDAACAIIRQGGVIVCATDTGYLLGADGLNAAAVRKIYQIKGRAFDKPIHLVVADFAMARTLGEFTPDGEAIFHRALPGPLTLIVHKTPRVPDMLVSGLPTVGLRMPRGAWLLELARRAGTPITATSANQSGQASSFTAQEALRELGAAAQCVDMIIDHGRAPHSRPSTLLDLTHRPPRILREGPFTQAMLSAMLAELGIQPPPDSPQ